MISFGVAMVVTVFGMVDVADIVTIVYKVDARSVVVVAVVVHLVGVTALGVRRGRI
ncbi:hypothetical protein F5141DRAFT_1103800, partial [Pisolithus sp. B1]